MATNKIQTGLRLPESMYEKLKVLSGIENRSMNNMIEYIIQVYLENYENQNGLIVITPEE